MDGSLFGGGESDHFEIPRIRLHSVCNVRYDFSGEAFFTIRIDDGECDRIFGVCDDSEVPLYDCEFKVPIMNFRYTYIVPSVWTAMESVVVVVLVGCDIVLCAIDHKAAILDAIGVTTCIFLATRHCLIPCYKIPSPGTPPRCGWKGSTE